jgi:hypothetical protein
LYKSVYDILEEENEQTDIAEKLLKVQELLKTLQDIIKDILQNLV